MYVYNECPVYGNGTVSLKRTAMTDAAELLKCYSDETAVPFFNSDNCDGDTFYYSTRERMEQAIRFWDMSYDNKYFVRWTVTLNSTGEKIGTVEMFRREADDAYNLYGLLRIDLQGKYETREVIEPILEIANHNFYTCFGVKHILTKAVPAARERILALEKTGYRPLGEKIMGYGSYFCRKDT